MNASFNFVLTVAPEIRYKVKMVFNGEHMDNAPVCFVKTSGCARFPFNNLAKEIRHHLMTQKMPYIVFIGL